MAQKFVIEFEGRVDKLEAAIKSLTAKFDSFADDTKKATDKAAKNFEALSSKIESGVGTVTGSMLRWGTAIAAIATGGGLHELIKVANEFEVAIADVNSILEKGAPSIENWSEAVRGLASGSTRDVVDLTKGLYEAISSGVPQTLEAGGAMDLLTVAQKAAIGGLATTSDAVRAGAAVINIYGKEAGSTTEIFDKLLQAVRSGMIHFPELAKEVGTLSTKAKAAGVSYEEMLASLTEVSKGMGGNVAEAATSLGALYQSLSAPGMRARKEVEELGLDMTKQAIASRGLLTVMKEVQTGITNAVGNSASEFRKVLQAQEANVAMNILLRNDGEAYTKSLQQQTEAMGNTDKAYEIHRHTAQAVMQNLKNNFDLLAISIKTSFENEGGALEGVAEWLKQIDTKQLTAQLHEVVGVLKGVAQTIYNLRGSIAVVLEVIVAWKAFGMLLGVGGLVQTAITGLGSGLMNLQINLIGALVNGGAAWLPFLASFAGMALAAAAAGKVLGDVLGEIAVKEYNLNDTAKNAERFAKTQQKGIDEEKQAYAELKGQLDAVIKAKGELHEADIQAIRDEINLKAQTAKEALGAAEATIAQIDAMQPKLKPTGGMGVRTGSGYTLEADPKADPAIKRERAIAAEARDLARARYNAAVQEAKDLDGVAAMQQQKATERARIDLEKRQKAAEEAADIAAKDAKEKAANGGDGDGGQHDKDMDRERKTDADLLDAQAKFLKDKEKNYEDSLRRSDDEYRANSFVLKGMISKETKAELAAAEAKAKKELDQANTDTLAKINILETLEDTKAGILLKGQIRKQEIDDHNAEIDQKQYEERAKAAEEAAKKFVQQQNETDNILLALHKEFVDKLEAFTQAFVHDGLGGVVSTWLDQMEQGFAHASAEAAANGDTMGAVWELLKGRGLHVARSIADSLVSMVGGAVDYLVGKFMMLIELVGSVGKTAKQSAAEMAEIADAAGQLADTQDQLADQQAALAAARAEPVKAGETADARARRLNKMQRDINKTQRDIGRQSDELNDKQAQAANPAGYAVSQKFDEAMAFIQGVVKGLPVLFEEIQKHLPELMKAVEKAIPAVAKEMARHMPQVVRELMNELPHLVDAMIAAVPDVVSAVINSLPPMIEKYFLLMFAKLPALAVALIDQLVSQFLEHADELVKAFADGIAQAILELVNKLTGGAVKVGSKLLHGDLGGAASELAGGGTTGTVARVGTAIATGGISEIASFFGGDIGGKIESYARGGLISHENSVISALRDAATNQKGVPAVLHPGERVLRAETTRRIEGMLERAVAAGTGGGGAAVVQFQSMGGKGDRLLETLVSHYVKASINRSGKLINSTRQLAEDPFPNFPRPRAALGY